MCFYFNSMWKTRKIREHCTKFELTCWKLGGMSLPGPEAVERHLVLRGAASTAIWNHLLGTVRICTSCCKKTKRKFQRDCNSVAFTSTEEGTQGPNIYMHMHSCTRTTTSPRCLRCTNSCHFVSTVMNAWFTRQQFGSNFDITGFKTQIARTWVHKGVLFLGATKSESETAAKESVRI